MNEFPSCPVGWRTIVADPPWPYDTTVKGTVALQKPKKEIERGDRHVSDFTYPVMPLEEICALPVKEMVAKNAHLYLWVTNSFMEQGYEVARSWGFKPNTIITWVKTRHDDPATPSMKAGYWFRGATEHVLFCTRGSCPKPAIAIPTAFLHPRIARHSEKPERFYTEVVERISPAPRLEMFARTQRRGWRSWGNQLD